MRNDRKSIFYLIGVVVAAAAAITGTVLTVLHFVNKKKEREAGEIVYEIDCESGDCDGCEMADQCGAEEAELAE